MQKHFTKLHNIKIHKRSISSKSTSRALRLLNHPPFMEEKLDALRCPRTSLHYKISTRSSRPNFKIAKVLKSISRNPLRNHRRDRRRRRSVPSNLFKFFWELEPKGFSLDTGTGQHRGLQSAHNKALTGSYLVRIRVSGVALPLRTVIWKASGCRDRRVRTCWTKLALRNLLPGQ
jgi:hypothetical protein